jgi:hypothetical protein
MNIDKTNNEHTSIRTELQMYLLYTKVEDCGQKSKESLLILLDRRLSKMSHR